MVTSSLYKHSLVLCPHVYPGRPYYMFARMCLLYLLYLHVIVIRAKGSYSGPSVYKIAGVICRWHLWNKLGYSSSLSLLIVDQLFFSRQCPLTLMTLPQSIFYLIGVILAWSGLHTVNSVQSSSPILIVVLLFHCSPFSIVCRCI